MIFVLIFISITSLVKSQTEIPCTPVESNILYSPNDGKCYLGIQQFTYEGSCPTSNSFKGTVQTAQGTITICQNYPPNTCPVHCQSCTGFGLSSCIACATSSTRQISSISKDQVMAKYTQSCSCMTGFIEQVPMQSECMSQEVVISQDVGCLYSCGSCTLAIYCQTCLSSYMINQTCDCQPGFYKSANFKQCLPCDQTCGTCITYPTLCLSCIAANKRSLLGATCPCITGYQEYPVKYPSCQQACPNPPNQCIAGTNICIGCYDNVAMQIVNNQCQCYPGTYMGILKQKCWPCHYSCATCSTAGSCDTCNPTSYRKLQGLCLCQSPTFDVFGQQQCVICNYSCATCVALTYCLTCPVNTNRIPLGFCKCIPYTYGEDYVSNVCLPYHYSCYLARLNGAYYDQCEYCADIISRQQDSQGRCPCKVKFYDVGVAQCQPCDYSCQTCQGPNNTDCLTCNLAANRILLNGQCVCKSGFGKVNDTTEVCQLCNQNCKTCSYINVCTTCTYSGVYRYLDTTLNTCLCLNGYYDKGTVQCGVCDKTCMTCSGPNYNQCTDCNSALFRVLLTNVCICMAGYYENYGMCILCYYACQTCDDVVMDHCTTCPSTRHPIRALPNDNFFSCSCNDPLAIDDGFSLQCQSCYYACLTCSGPQSNNCMTCFQHTDASISREYINQSCVCPIYWFDDGSNEACQKCDYTCETCFDSTNQGCITCTASLFRQQLGNSCSCIDGYYEDLVNFVCAKCQYSCATCDQDPTNCTSCGPDSQRILTPQSANPLYNDCQCSAAFPNDQIGNPICQLCHYSCKTCSDDQDNTCLSCDSSLNRYQFTDNTGSYCRCNPHSFDSGDSQCSVCSDLCWECIQDEAQCTSCQASDFRQLSGTTCICATRLLPQNLSYYEDEFQACQECHYSCTQCNGAGYQSCTTCSAQDNRQQNGNQCDCLFNYIDLGNSQCDQCNYSCLGCQNTQTFCLSCPLNSLRIFQNNLCQCPLGYYDDGTVICQQCDVTCQTCSGLNTYCLSCDTTKNRYLFNNTCSCLAGYYDSGSNCLKCHQTCSSCSGPNQNDCSICPTYLATQRVYQNGSCPCSDGFYDDQINQKCYQCSQLCLTCQNATSCQICKSGLNRQINNGQCLCIPQYYEQNQQIICQQCSPYCLGCINQSDQCNLCDNTLFRQLNTTNKQCECLQGYYDNGSLQCQVCSYKCQTCNQLGCLTCNSNNFRIFNANSCDCIDGTFDNGTAVCVACNIQCATCIDANSCQSCNLINKRQLVGLQCQCIQGYFENNSSVCSLCDQTCLTCENTSSNCTQCDSSLFRELQNNNCVCMSGRYNNNGTCQICSTSCQTCDTTSTNCTSCPNTRYLINNQCQCNNGYYDSGSQICQICNYTCSTCTNSSTNCLTCNTLGHRTLQSNQCPCQNGFYDNGSQICIQCNVNCLTCTSSQVCTSCSSTNNRKLVVDKCLCLDNYYNDGTQVCKQCDPQCVTCVTQPTQCTSCNIAMTFRKDQSFNYNQCPCLPGFYDDGTLFCKKCSYKCVQCSNQGDNCTFCNTNLGTQRLNIIPSCPCQNGYYDDGIQINCQKCHQRCLTCETNSTNCLSCQNSVLRNPAPLCSCLQGYFEDSNFQCLQCSMKCQSCSNQLTCLICQPDRIGASCICAEGYYEANQIMCQQCDRKCQNCLSDSLNCTKCKGDRINPPNCVCQDHYYDNQVDENCLTCDSTCFKCDINGCLDCAANRILNGNTCDCPINSISYTTTPWCSNCEAAVVKSSFSDDLNYITIEFEYELKFNFQILVQPEEYCSQIFQNDTLDKLGNVPYCNISDNILNIYLGFGSLINADDELKFNENTLIHENCAKPIKDFILTNIQASKNLLEPNVSLSYPSNPVSPCYDIIIQIISQTVNAQRNLIVKWGSYDQNNLQSALNQANQYQYTTLTLPQFSLQELKQYQFYLQVINIFNATLIQNFTIETLSYGSPQIQIQNYQKSFYRRFPIKINLFYQNYLCSNQQNIAKNGTVTISLQYIPEQTIIQTNSSTIASGNIAVIIPAKTLDVDKSYVIRATVTDENQKSSYNDYSFKVELSPLFVEIVGGTQVVDYKKPINVVINALDMDYNTTQGIEYSVECIQLATKSKCSDTLGNVIKLNSTQPKQYLRGNLFNPFTILQFNINCTKGNLKTSTSGTFIVLESDYPNIQVNYSQSYQQRLINIGEDLQFLVILPQDTKETLISVALIYNYDTVSIRSVKNQEIQFSIWDMFIDFTFLSQISVRIQVHDLRYFLPSLFAINLNMNLPPIQSVVKITPQEGDSLLTQFTISVQNAKHINTPILYRYAFYETDSSYQEDIMNRQNNNLQVIKDFNSLQQLNFIMESGNITILVSVSDSLGSIANYTQQIVVNSFSFYLNRTSTNCSSFLSSLSQYSSTEQLLTISIELIKLYRQGQCQSLIISQLNYIKSQLLNLLQTEQQTMIQRIFQALSQIMEFQQNNSSDRMLQQKSQSLCYNKKSQKYQQINPQQSNDAPNHQSELISNQIAIIKNQVTNAISEQNNLINQLTQLKEIGDSQSSWQLKYNFKQRVNLFKMISSLYPNSYDSRMDVFKLITQLQQSFQQGLILDGQPVQIKSDSINSTIRKVTNKNFMKLLINTNYDDDEEEEESLVDINKIISIIKFKTSPIIYELANEFTNLIDSPVVVPVIYSEQSNTYQINNKLWQKQFIINSFYELQECQIQNTTSYDLYCFQLQNVAWVDLGCQMIQYNQSNKLIIACQCGYSLPITLTLKGSKIVNSSNDTQIVNYQQHEIRYEFVANQYLQYILGLMILILPALQIFNKSPKSFSKIENIKSDLSESNTHRDWITARQQYKYPYFSILKNLHEITRIYIQNYTYINRFQRTLLLLQNISVIAILSHVLQFVGFSIPLSVCITIFGQLIFQIFTKIVEGFHSGPIFLKCIGYVITISIIFGCSVFISFSNSDSNNEDIYVFLISLTLIYALIEPFIQFIRLKIVFQLYQILQVDTMNPVIHFVYYFFQDEYINYILTEKNEYKE